MTIIEIKNVNDKMPYGTHQGKSIQYVIENYPEYAKWMIWNMQAVKFSGNIRAAVRQFQFQAR